MTIRTRAIICVALMLSACGGSDPLGAQLSSDIKEAESESTYDFRHGFVSQWDNLGEPAFASCIVLGFETATRTFRSAKIYPHGGGAVSIGLGDDYNTQKEWRKYCASPMLGADGKPVEQPGA